MIVRVPMVSTHSLNLHCARQRVEHNSTVKILIQYKTIKCWVVRIVPWVQTLADACPSFHSAPHGSSEGVSCRRAFEQSANCASNNQSNGNTCFFRHFFLGNWCLIRRSMTPSWQMYRSFIVLFYSHQWHRLSFGETGTATYPRRKPLP